MTNLVLIGNIISILASNPATNFSLVASHAQADEQMLMEEHSIDTWDEYYSYLQENETNSDSGKGEPGKKITDLFTHLTTNYPGYSWFSDEEKSALTSDVSSFIPIEMQYDFYIEDEIDAAIIKAGIEDKTSYGGCGPIAIIGILDYFARYLGYNEIIQDPLNESQRIALATEVFENTYYSIFGDQEETLVWPWDAKAGFNDVIKIHGLGNIISANDVWSLFSGKKDEYWNKIVKSINEGIPVTMFNGSDSSKGNFAGHYTNIYGYETWIGRSKTDNSIIEKQFVKARLNWGESEEYYCDADILNESPCGLITYNINYSNKYEFHASDFAEEFVNSAGGGQYFFYDREANVELLNGKTLVTHRKRCSYIENQYLVLSPNRIGAETAYLDILFPHFTPKLTVDMAMWSDSEGAINENFILQYMTETGWKDHVSISPYDDLPTLRDYPQTYTFLFPKNTKQIRFFATQINPTVDRNKGRIVLDNFIIEYN